MSSNFDPQIEKTPGNPAAKSAPSMFQSRPFGVQPKPGEVSPSSPVPSLQRHLKITQGKGDRMSQMQVSQRPAIQPQLTICPPGDNEAATTQPVLIVRHNPQSLTYGVSTAPLGLVQRTIVPTDLHAFGNKSNPRDPRAGKDITVDPEGYVAPTNPPTGASTFGNVNKAPLTGHYHRLPAGDNVSDDIEIIADGRDVGGTHQETHHTIYPARRMPITDFIAKFQGLGWKYGGKK